MCQTGDSSLYRHLLRSGRSRDLRRYKCVDGLPISLPCQMLEHNKTSGKNKQKQRYELINGIRYSRKP